MSEYKAILGRKIQYLTSDPSPLEVGNVWYNSTAKALKAAYSTTVAATWSSGGNLNNSTRANAASGTQTSALTMGGSPSVGFVKQTWTEEYDGSSWTTGGSLATARANGAGASASPQTASLVAGGYVGPAPSPAQTTSATEEYDGTSWAAGGNLNLSRQFATNAGAGTQTAALAIGGYTYAPGGPADVRADTEEYNGSSWTSGGNLNYVNFAMGTTGIETSAITMGGGYITGAPAGLNTTELYNGTSWSVSGNMANARNASSGAGPGSAALAFAGTGAYPSPNVAATEQFNGSTWTSASANLGTPRSGGAGCGTQTAALMIGGTPNAPAGDTTTATEEFNGPFPSIVAKTITLT
jgi:hypothetical protein